MTFPPLSGCTLVWYNKQSSTLHKKKIQTGVVPKVSGGEQRAEMLSSTSWRFMAELHLFIQPISRASFTELVTVSSVS